MQITDSASDAVLISRVLLTAGFSVNSATVATEQELRTALAGKTWQLVIVHDRAASLSANDTLPILGQTDPDLPCIVVSDQVGKNAVELLKAGARDYVLQEDLSRLGTAVETALQLSQERAKQRRAEEALKESEARFSQTFHISPDSINLNRLKDGVYIDINEGFTKILGYTRDDVIGRSSLLDGLNVWANKEDRDRLVAGLKTTGEVIGLEAPFRSKDGRIVFGLMSARILQLGGEDCILSFTRDITARKQAEAEREATIRLLHLCNEHDSTHELMHELILFFHELTGCETIGIRLREGSAFPYYESRVFAPDLVEDGCRLCPPDSAEEMVRDDAGLPVLSCLCSQILRQRCDTTKPGFTQDGSFWTNSATESDRKAGLYYRCNNNGYKSVALIPLRGPTEPIGLLQINDRRTDRFIEGQIELLEALANHAAIALLKLDSERALRSSEEHLRAVLDTSEAGYFFIDPAGRFQHVNPAWLRLHGYEREEEVLGQHFSVTLVEADQEATTAHMNALLAGIEQPAGEFSRRRKDGSVGHHTFSAHVVREEGRGLGVEGFLIDTTRLRQIREEYKMLFEQMLDGFALHEIVFDPAGKPTNYRFLAVNPAFEHITGLKAAEVIGKCLSEVLPSSEHKWIGLYGQVAITGEPRRFEESSSTLGKHFEVLAFRPKDGELACLIQDVTSRRQLEMQLLQAQKMEAIGQLAGGVAHDFNNILSATMMHLGLLMQLPTLSPSLKQSLKELETETKRATGLTRQLLLFSRRQSLHFCPTDLNDLLANLLKMLQRLIGEHIQVVFPQGNSSLWIDADPGLIEQVVMNLCVNARDAMPQGGRLTVEATATKVDSTKTLGDTESRSGEFVCLAVSDTGCGMDETTLKHIFEPFFTTKEEGKGTGLGLATVYSIVKQHHGWITVQSTVNRGTVFRIFLPAGTMPTRPANTINPPCAVEGGTEGILVVEDDPGFRNMVVMTLKVLGYRVFEAIDGRAALVLWEKHAPEITMLFTDQVMPGGISGLELCNRLHKAKPTLRRIITTGYYSTDRSGPEQLALADIDFLPKPFSSETLANIVRRCIDQTNGVSLPAPEIRPQESLPQP